MKNVADKALLILAVLFLAGCSGRFRDYQEPVITVTPDGVKVPECETYDISSEQPAVLGCYVKSSRWQIMVHPEKMVPSDKKTAESGNAVFKE